MKNVGYMDSNEKFKFNVKTVDEQVNYWVVRAGEEATYLEHFQQNGLIAIGHLDELEYDKHDLDRETVLHLVARYKKKLVDGGALAKSAGNRSGQVLSFITKIKKGDIVISMNASSIIVGIVSSNAYKSEKQRLVRDVDGKIVGKPLTYSLRRRVSWGNIISRKTVPAMVSNSLRANQAVFCINEHWQTINHWLSVIFIKDDTVYFSSKIKQKKKIKNFDISQYSQILNILEAISSGINEISSDFTQDEINHAISTIYNRYQKQRLFELNTQQSFMSPGDYWGSLNGDQVKKILFIMAFCSLFDMEPVFANERDNKVGEKYKEVIDVSIALIKEEQGFSYVKEGLQVSVPKPYNIETKKDGFDKPVSKKKFPPKKPSERGEI